MRRQPAVRQIQIRIRIQMGRWRDPDEIPLRTASSCRRVRRRILLSARRPSRDEKAKCAREQPTREVGSALVGVRGMKAPRPLAARWSHVWGGGPDARVLGVTALSCLLAIFLRRSGAMDRRHTAAGSGGCPSTEGKACQCPPLLGPSTSPGARATSR